MCIKNIFIVYKNKIVNFSTKQTKKTFLNTFKKKTSKGKTCLLIYAFYAYKKHLSESCLFTFCAF